MSFTFSSGKSRDAAGFIEQRRVQIQFCRFSKNCVSSESQLLNRQSYLMMKLGNFWLPCKVRICEHLRAYHNRSFVTEMKKKSNKSKLCNGRPQPKLNAIGCVFTATNEHLVAVS